jgi:hypothetical protein
MNDLPLPKDLQQRLKKAITHFWACRGSQAVHKVGKRATKIGAHAVP